MKIIINIVFLLFAGIAINAQNVIAVHNETGTAKIFLKVM